MLKSRILGALAVSKENADELISGSLATTEEAAAAAPVAPVAAPEVLPELPVVEEPSEAGEELAEVAEAAQEVAEGESAVEQVEEAATALESLIDLLKGDAEDGLTPQAARLAQFSAESILATVGLKAEDAGLPSLESFNTHSTRVKATVLSTEALGEKLKQLWAAIVEMLRKIKDGIVTFIKKLVSAQFRVSERANKLAAAAAKTSGSAKEAELDLGSLAGRVAIGDKIDQPLTKGVEIAAAVLEDMLKYGEAETAYLTEFYNEIAQAVTSGKAVEGAPKFVGMAILPSGKAFKHKVEGKYAVASTDTLPGNIVLQHGFDRIGSDKLALYFPVNGKSKKDATVGNTKIKTLAPNEIQALIKAVQDLLAQAKSVSEKAAAEVERSKKTFSGLKIGDEAKIADKVQLHSMMKAFQRGEAAQGKAAAAAAAYAVELGNSYLTIAQKSLAQYGSTTTVAKAE